MNLRTGLRAQQRPDTHALLRGNGNVCTSSAFDRLHSPRSNWLRAPVMDWNWTLIPGGGWIRQLPFHWRTERKVRADDIQLPPVCIRGCNHVVSTSCFTQCPRHLPTERKINFIHDTKNVLTNKSNCIFLLL